MTGHNCDLLGRFFDRISPEPNSGCWLWLGAMTVAGYGVFNLGARSNRMLAHRWAYIQKYGAILGGLEMDHKCRVRSCVNPDHLEAVSHRENILRGIAPAAQHAKKTHCPAGHDYNHVRRGSRECKICHATQERERKRRLRAAFV